MPRVRKDNDARYANAVAFEELSQETSTKLENTTDTLTGDLTVTGRVDAGSVHIADADSLSFEAGKHWITYNDGAGNFNLRVGHYDNAGGTEESTESGYVFHEEWSQSGGTWQFNISDVSTTAGQLNVTDWNWRNQLQIDTNEVSLRYQGVEVFNTASGGVAVTGNISVTGTVDGRDVATDGTKLDTIDTNANNYTFPYTVSSSAGNSTVVQRNANGYIYCNYLNCTSGATATAPSHIMVETGNDSFVRQQTPANLISNLALATTTALATEVATNKVRAYSGTQLVLNAGESNGQATGQNGELVYINAEGGLQVNSSPDNWATAWAGRTTATINAAGGASTFPGSVTATNFIGNLNGYATSTSGTANTYALRNGSADIYARLFRSTYTDQTTMSGAIAYRVSTTDNYIRYCNTPSSVIAWLGTDRRLATGLNPIYGTGTSYCTYQSSSATKYARWYLEGDEDMRLTEGGALICNSNVTAYSTTIASDARLKRDVKTLPSALDTVCKLRGVSFTWNEQSPREGVEDIGLIAQEVQEIVPEIVEEVEGLNDTGAHLTVAYPKLVSYLIEAVKEQQQQIDELKERLNDLTG